MRTGNLPDTARFNCPRISNTDYALVVCQTPVVYATGAAAFNRPAAPPAADTFTYTASAVFSVYMDTPAEETRVMAAKANPEDLQIQPMHPVILYTIIL